MSCAKSQLAIELYRSINRDEGSNASESIPQIHASILLFLVRQVYYCPNWAF